MSAKRSISLLVKVLTLLVVIQSLSAQNTTVSSEVSEVAAAQNKFCIELYQALAKSNEGNLFFSPFSISTVLAMTYLGSKDNTETELKNVLHFPEDKENLKLAYNELMMNYKTVHPEFELKTSNAMYVSDLMKVLEEFSSVITKDFMAVAENVNFGDSEIVRQKINARVEKETNSRIKDVIPLGVLDSFTRMVLVNAIYFKGFWKNKFNAYHIEEREFWITPSKSVMIPMMSVKNKFRFTSLPSLDARMLSMDYEGGSMSMTILLPNKKYGLPEMETRLANENLLSLSQEARSTEVLVIIPKFKLEETLNLVDTLKEMGVKDLFDDQKADLSGINGKTDLYVSHAIHKAFLEVNEEGSEAAAATGVHVIKKRSLELVETFEADHPFLYTIGDSSAKTVLFMGLLTQAQTSWSSLKDEL